jgi:MoxR-like ATPase
MFRTKLTDEPRSSVVLIDEIDKAPRDFTNDLLNEVENREFLIQEQGDYRIEQSNSQQVLIIMTSNSEKNLPDAFLRRCIFYHIPFPDSAQLKRIIQSGLPAGTGYTEALLDNLIDTFNEIRKKSVRKPPATAELLAWIHILGLKGIERMPDKEQKKQMLTNLSVLVKTREDYDAVKNVFQGVTT